MASRYLIPFGGRGLTNRGDPFLSLHREMNRLFDDTFRAYGDDDGGRRPGAAMAHVDVHESDGELCVTADLPGVDQSDIDLRIEGDTLTIRGEKKRKDDRDERGYHVMERSSASFERTIRLPFEPDPDKVRAECANGVLTVHVPKEGRQERSRKIAIGGGGGAAGRTINADSRAANDARSEDRQMAASHQDTPQAGGSDDTGGSQGRSDREDAAPDGN